MPFNVLCLAGKRQGFFVMRVKAQIMDEAAVKRALVRISHEIVEKNDGVGDIILAGIKRRGVPLSQLIADNIKKIEDKEIPLGILDISLYRDDLTRLNENPEVRNTEFPFDITGKKSYPGRRCHLYGKNGESGDRSAFRMRETGYDTVRGPYRQRPQRASDKSGFCRQERSHIPQ